MASGSFIAGINRSARVDRLHVGIYNADMTCGNNSAGEKLWQAILWTLRGTVALQCVGNWRWLTQIEETPLLHWMLDPSDVGGLAWSESTALAVQQIVGWLVLLAAGAVVWRSHVAVLAPLVVLQTLITMAMWRTANGYQLQITWISPWLLTLFPFATQLGRIAAPLGLLFIAITKDNRRVGMMMQILRWAIAVVFLAHGVEACQLNPKFLDLLINATQRLFGLDLSQSTAEQCLVAIGVVDIVLAIICVSYRSLTVLCWMAFWGAATAGSRIVANGWEMQWHESLARISHFGIPLAVVLWWHLLKYRAEELRAGD